MGTVYGGDPTYHASPGESLEQAAAGVLERRLHWLKYGGRKVAVKPGDTADTLSQRWTAEAPKQP